MDNCLKTINFWTFGNTPYVMNHPNVYKLHEMKNEKNYMIFLKIWSISLEHLVEHKPIISEEYECIIVPIVDLKCLALKFGLCSSATHET